VTNPSNTVASLLDRNGTWYAQFYSSDRSPSRKRFSLQTKSKREARRCLTKLEDACGAGEFDPWTDDPFDYESADGPQTLSQAIEKFVAEKKRQGRAERTIGSYEQVWGLFADRLGAETELSDVTAGQIEDFIHDRSVSESTRHNRWRHVRAVLKWTGSDVVENVNPPKEPDKLPTPVRRDELTSLTEALKAEYREKRQARQCQPGQMIWCVPLFRFVFYSGLRASEVARLKWADIDRDRGLIYITEQKNGREQTVPLISKAEDALGNAPRPHEPDMYVFRSPTGPETERSEDTFADHISRTFCKARRRAEIGEKTLHDLRAGYATALADAGLSAHQIKEACRHASISTSEKYVRVSRTKLRSDMESAFS
jgi:integrase